MRERAVDRGVLTTRPGARRAGGDPVALAKQVAGVEPGEGGVDVRDRDRRWLLPRDELRVNDVEDLAELPDLLPGTELELLVSRHRGLSLKPVISSPFKLGVRTA